MAAPLEMPRGVVTMQVIIDGGAMSATFPDDDQGNRAALWWVHDWVARFLPVMNRASRVEIRRL